MRHLHQKPLKLLWISICMGLFLAVSIQLIGDFFGDCGEIRESVLRLHILANSDTQKDQQLKLDVRDRILEETEDLFNQIDSVNSAKQTAEEHLEEITAIAQQEVWRQGYDYPVKTQVCRMFFDTRNYENFSLPAGQYDAVRITIGEAKGHNWWCVLYPPLCLPAAMPEEELESDLTPRQADMIEHPEHYQVRFAVVELWEKLKISLAS
ncbi:MAG: stage II sporulation protein R [Massiliimalia sp.]